MMENNVFSKSCGLQNFKRKPGIERVQALTDISHLALCCHSNEAHAPMANVPNSAQLEGTPYHSPNLHLGPCSGVGMRRGTQTDGRDHYTFCLGYASREM